MEANSVYSFFFMSDALKAWGESRLHIIQTTLVRNP